MPSEPSSDGPPRRVLTVNAGSSSIKAALFAAGRGAPVRIRRAEVTGIRKLASLAVEDEQGRRDSVPLLDVHGHSGALRAMIAWVRDRTEEGPLAAIGHRIVHGGERHVRGYKEEGTTTTPFDMLMLNDLDRFHLVMDVIDRVPGLGSRAVRIRQEMIDRRTAERDWTRTHGEDDPDVAGWVWS